MCKSVQKAVQMRMAAPYVKVSFIDIHVTFLFNTMFSWIIYSKTCVLIKSRKG